MTSTLIIDPQTDSVTLIQGTDVTVEPLIFGGVGFIRRGTVRGKLNNGERASNRDGGDMAGFGIVQMSPSHQTPPRGLSWFRTSTYRK